MSQSKKARQQKLGIIGVGHVGQNVLQDILHRDVFGEIVLIDVREDHTKGEALDQRHATGLFSRNNVDVYQGQYSDLADADMIIVAATAMYPVGQAPLDRQELLKDNIPVLKEIMEGIMAHTTEAILIFISNPVDTMTHLAISEFGYPADRCLGTGTMLDSARLKYQVAQHYEVDPKNVSGYMMGEHGASAFAVTSRLSVEGIHFDELADYFPEKEDLDVAQLSQDIVEAANIVYMFKSGVTDAAIGQAACQLAVSIMLDEQTIYPVATYHEAGVYGLEEPLTFSVPTKITRQGVDRTFEVSLNDWETEKLKATIDTIQKSVNLGKQYLAELN